MSSLILLVGSITLIVIMITLFIIVRVVSHTNPKLEDAEKEARCKYCKYLDIKQEDDKE